jgi:hypothetical protein
MHLGQIVQHVSTLHFFLTIPATHVPPLFRIASHVAIRYSVTSAIQATLDSKAMAFPVHRYQPTALLHFVNNAPHHLIASDA